MLGYPSAAPVARALLEAYLTALQRRLWQRVDLLLTSSPAFIRNYFAPCHFPAPIRLVENKVALLDGNGWIAKSYALLQVRPGASVGLAPYAAGKAWSY